MRSKQPAKATRGVGAAAASGGVDGDRKQRSSFLCVFLGSSTILRRKFELILTDFLVQCSNENKFVLINHNYDLQKGEVKNRCIGIGKQGKKTECCSWLEPDRAKKEKN